MATIGEKRPLQRALKSASALAGAALIGAPLFCGAALAQDDEGFAFEEIIVTSKKREQSIYEAPVAVTAFSNQQLESRGIIDLVDVGKFVPNLNVTTFSAGNTSSANPFIRGIGIQDHLIVTDPGVGVYIDGVYLGRQVGQNWSLSNIERLEVLRGPQGTLFGRNTIGGAINIITQRPGDEDVARFSLQAGSRGRFNGDFYGNTRLNDELAVSGNVSVRRRDGIGDFVNIRNPEARVGELMDISGRVAALWEPNDRFSLLISADGNDARNGQNPFETIINESADCATDFQLAFCLGGITNADQAEDRFDTTSGQADLAQTFNSAYGVNVTAEGVISDNLSAKLIGSYRYSEYEGGLDDDGAFIDFFSFPEVGNASQYSFEAQLNGDYDTFNFVLGAYYFNEDGSNIQQPVTFIGPGGFFEQSQETDSYAIFGNAGVDITEDFRITGGLRYTWDEKDAFTNLGFAPPFSGSEDWQELTWEATATYDLQESLSVYGAISRGYQSGQFPARPFGGEATFVPTDPVIATNYEGGIKGEPFPWLQMALTGFYTRYRDLPAQVSEVTQQGFITVTQNAGRSRSIGVEWESRARLAEGFFINSSVGFIDAEFTEVDENVTSLTVGDTPALTPRWTVALGPEYTFPVTTGGEVTLRGDWSYRSEMEGQPNNDPLALIESRSIINFDITYTSADESWTFGAYGRNVADERYVNAALNVGDYLLRILNNDASEFGARFTKNFGG
ncbi:MAG: TonB-dependent receptor [Pseudomonadota bacterium]